MNHQFTFLVQPMYDFQQLYLYQTQLSLPQTYVRSTHLFLLRLLGGARSNRPELLTEVTANLLIFC